MRAYDATADVLIVQLVPGGGEGERTVQVSEDITIELDSAGRPLELVIEHASKYYGPQDLQAAAAPTIELSLAAAAKEARVHPDSLRVQIHRKRLKATKRGRDWVVSAVDLANYLANKDPRGAKPGSKVKRKRARRKTAR